MNDPEKQKHPASALDEPAAEPAANDTADAQTKREKTPAQRAAAARKRARRMAKMRPAGEVADILYARFPNALFRDSRSRQPLEVGVHLKLLERVGDDLHKLEVQRFMNNYAHSLGYLHSIASRRPRIDLDGQPAGEDITDEMVADARTEIDKIQEMRAARGDKPKRGPAGAKKKADAPRKGGRGGGYLGMGKSRGKPVEGSAAELKENLQQRNFRTAKIIEKKPRRPSVGDGAQTLMARKLADAGLAPAAPRKKLRLGKKSEPER